MTIKGFLDVAVPVVTLAMGYLVYSLDRSVRTFDLELKRREADRSDVQQQADVRFRIYDAVTKSLESPDARRQSVATALVVSMLEPDDSLTQGLLEVLQSQAAPEVKTQATQAITEARLYTAEQALVTQAAAPAGSDWRGYNLDIFWCGANGARANDAAKRIHSALAAAGAKGRLRVRELADSINASPGYRIAGLAIRQEPGEEAVASSIKSIADGAMGGQFVLTGSRQGTPGYLSLFVCR